MHISPCGWYCFNSPNPELWNMDDSPEKTDLHCIDGSCSIELLCARKSTEAIDDEISQMHEDYLEQEHILPEETILSENPFKVKYYVTQGTGLDENKRIIGHAYWNNYCIFIQYKGEQNTQMELKVKTFYDILNSLQPLSEI